MKLVKLTYFCHTFRGIVYEYGHTYTEIKIILIGIY